MSLIMRMNIVIDFPALGQLMVVSKCICPGRELRLECTVVGGGNTIWRGTSLDCPDQDNEILLPHAQFGSGEATRVCNNRMIIGRSLNRTFDGSNSIYISQLTIQLPLRNGTNDTLEGKTVKCIHDNGTTITTINAHTIAYTRDGMWHINTLKVYILYCQFMPFSSTSW